MSPPRVWASVSSEVFSLITNACESFYSEFDSNKIVIIILIFFK